MAELEKRKKLITYAYLKDEVDLPRELPDYELEGKIYDAQETLRMLMGDEFYKSFLNEYLSNQWTGANAALYDPYVKQYVARQAHEYWIVKANFKPTNAGFRVHTEDNSTPATQIDMAPLIKDAKQKAQYYKKLLVDYLEGNASLYPLYNASCGNDLTGNTFHISAVRKDGCNHKRSCRC